MYPRSLACLRQMQLGTILHLDQRTIAQAKHRAAIFRRAHLLALLQLRTIADGRCTRVSNLINLTFRSLNSRFELTVRPESLHKRNSQKANTDHHGRGNRPAHHSRLLRVERLAHGWLDAD